MSLGTKRVGLAALVIGLAVALVAFLSRPADAPASSEPRERARAESSEPLAAPPVAITRADPAPASQETPPPSEAAEPAGPRPAPGAAPWASGLDMPPPELPDSPPSVDPAHMRYREQAADVAPADQVAYLEQSLQMIDTSIEILTGDLEEARGTARAATLGTRLSRLRQARAERAEELDVMRARAASAPAPEGELEGGAAIRARGAAPASEGI